MKPFAIALLILTSGFSQTPVPVTAESILSADLQANEEVLQVKEVDYVTDVRPILFSKCASCHGPDANKRKKKLRFDKAVTSQEIREQILTRIQSHDSDELMPPAETKKPLSKEEIATLKQWVAQGTPWVGHWAYEKPVKPDLPTINNSAWPKNEIDYFVLNKIEASDLKPTTEADKASLIRRLSFDITGLPPTAKEVKAFIDDKDPKAYENLIHRLFKRPAHGEHMATFWMDSARYADSNGGHHDTNRSIWPWRDWVIKAYQNNMSFDQFTIEQIAGDMLPNASAEQKIATGFHRNTMYIYEGGADPEEFRTKAVADRVETTMTVWMGVTMLCCKCHHHKYDPITQKEFFQMYSFFNNVPETGAGGGPNKPMLTLANSKTTTLVMEEMEKPRQAFIHIRGVFLDKGENVSAQTPKEFHGIKSEAGKTPSRLDLAKWLVDKDNPLTGRVTMNRLWQQIFGLGIVKASNEFGLQGDTPSHPELLDWLAVEFIEDYDVQKMMTLMFMSATYRQASRSSEALNKRDPENRLLARGARFRMNSEMLRDNVLSVSGLLHQQVGGPSVYPYQTAGLWRETGLGERVGAYPTSKGKDQYRRGLYTYARRSMPYPNSKTFDSPNREYCVVQRSRTNTPLQALVMLNNKVFIEAARVLAEKIIKEGGDDKIDFVFNRCLSRSPSAKEKQLLSALQQQRLSFYKANPEKAKQILVQGLAPYDKELRPENIAAWTMVVNVLMNLDEFVTKGD